MVHSQGHMADFAIVVLWEDVQVLNFIIVHFHMRQQMVRSQLYLLSVNCGWQPNITSNSDQSDRIQWQQW